MLRSVTNQKDADALPPPTLEVATEEVYVFVAGGTTAGKPDPSVLVAINDTTLLHRSAATGGTLVARPLPETWPQREPSPPSPAPAHAAC